MIGADQPARRQANLRDFGLVADSLATGSAANSEALNRFGLWARGESRAGRAVNVVVPPGTYHYDWVAAADCFKGISKLNFSGHGATFLQTRPGVFPWPVSVDTLLYRNPANPRIADAQKGDTRVVATTPSELAHFAVGEMVMIAGLDIQYNGYPPNLYCFDYVRIRAIDRRSGAVQFDPPLSYDYLANFPSYGSQDLYAGSRIYKLDRNGFTWDVDHSFSGLTCRHVAAGSNYVIGMGRKITFRDCDVPGFAETVCETFLAERCIERLHCEPDKLVKSSTRRGGDVKSGIGIQSASIDRILIENCRTPLLATGGKMLTVRDCTIGQIGFGGMLGFCDSAVLENCRIDKAQYFYPYQPSGARANFVDGVNVTYANGVFTVLKNALSGLAIGGGLSNWNLLPGQPLQFCRGKPGDTSPNGSHLASDLGTGIVLSVRDRPDAILIATTLKSSRVPAWSSGQVFVKRRNAPVLRNCSGAEQVRLASDAARAGKAFGDYFRYVFDAKTLVPGITLSGRTGRLVRFSANVLKPMPGGKLTLGELAAYRASTMGSLSHYYIDIDLSIAGRRDFTVTGLRGAAGKDLVSWDAQPQKALPVDLWCENGMPSLFCPGAPFTARPATAPVFELIFEFDVGLLARPTAIRRNAP